MFTEQIVCPGFVQNERHELARNEYRRAAGLSFTKVENFPNEYLSRAARDLQRTSTTFWNASRPPLKPRATMNLQLTESLILDAFCIMEGPAAAKFVLSHGLQFAIDDFTMRAACNRHFFSCVVDSEFRQLWNGSDCLWLKGGVIHPQIRFYDYRMQVLNPLAHEEPAGFLSAFYAAIPSDNTRYSLAVTMAAIGLCWTLMHEDAHYWEGHQHFLSHTLPRLGIDGDKIGEVTQVKAPNEVRVLRKVFEWQADRSAARAIIDIFGSADMLDMLPSYFKSEPKWLLRLLIISIGSVILLFHKAGCLYGNSDEYPSPRARLIGAVRAAVARWQENIPRHGMPLRTEDIIDVSVMSLFDLQVASEILPEQHDTIDRGPGMHPSIAGTNMDFFGSLRDIKNCVLSMYSTSGNPPPYVHECNQLVDQHDQQVFSLMSTFRKMAAFGDFYQEG